jgi:hypothetical protein
MANKRVKRVCRMCLTETKGLRNVGQRRVFLICESCATGEKYSTGIQWTDEEGNPIRQKPVRKVVTTTYHGDIYTTDHRGKDDWARDSDGRLYHEGVCRSMYHQVIKSSTPTPTLKSLHFDKLLSQTFGHDIKDEYFIFINYRDIIENVDKRIGPFSEEEYYDMQTEAFDVQKQDYK